jgi:hypothetical protein
MSATALMFTLVGASSCGGAAADGADPPASGAAAMSAQTTRSGRHGGHQGEGGPGSHRSKAGARGGHGCHHCGHHGGNDAQASEDMRVFHFLLDNREKIDRRVTKLPNGVQTVTESNDPAVAQGIRDHVQAMRLRLTEKRPIHARDPLFAAIFRSADDVQMSVEPTANGVKIVETSANPRVVALIQAHADVVSKFIENGRAEMHKDHPVPKDER